MDLGFLKKKDPFYYSIKELLNFKPKSLKFYKRAFTHRSLNKKDLNGFAVNYERLERISISSLKQSSQFFKPQINEIENFSEFITKNKEQKIMANLKTKNFLKKDSIVSNTLCLIIGPEGGFSDDEIQEARDNKVTEISFGENRLRSETAAIYGLSLIKSIIS